MAIVETHTPSRISHTVTYTKKYTCIYVLVHTMKQHASLLTVAVVLNFVFLTSN